MTLRTLQPKAAADLDAELMNTGGFSIDQLMELAGLSVAECERLPFGSYSSSPKHELSKLLPSAQGKKVLVACGPGNNGGDGLVAARHLFHFGYMPIVFYPKQGKTELFKRLATQLGDLNIQFTHEFMSEMHGVDLIVDSVFGFSFSGEVREPFPAVIEAFSKSAVPVLAVDAPSSWDIETGPPSSGPGSNYFPTALISLTAPKPLVSQFKGKHFVGGRFLSPSIARKYELDIPNYKGTEQVAEVSNEEQKL